MKKTASIPLPTKDASEAEIAAFIEQAKAGKHDGRTLLPYLPFQHPIYAGRSGNAVIRMRGFLLAAFAKIGLPDEALPYVLAVLESERSAYLIAAAAMALRGRRAPAPDWAPLLQKAFRNVKLVDDAVSFDEYQPRWPLENSTTALQEIVKTLEWMGPSAAPTAAYFREQCGDLNISDLVKAQLRGALAAIQAGADSSAGECCRPLFSDRTSRGSARGKVLPRAVAELALEDHAGARVDYGDFFSGAPAVVVLFYTRCDNPSKCSLTVTRLGQLQKQLAVEGLAGRVKSAAITYDPVYDSAARIQAYCEKRGVELGELNRAFRIESGTPTLLRYLDSGVNYIGSVVNHHTIELFLLDERGRLRGRFQQRQWHPDEAVAAVKKLVGPEAGAGGPRGRLGTLFPPLLSVLTLVSPKCPICWAAYLSVLGLNNVAWLKWTGWLPPLFAGLLAANLFSLYRGTARNGWLPFFLCLAGALFIGASLQVGSASGLRVSGLVLSSGGALLNSLPYLVYRRLMRACRWRRTNAGRQQPSFYASEPGTVLPVRS